MQPTPKLSYQAPRAVVLGDAASVIQMNDQGDETDANFPAGTPRGDLTFS